MSDDDFGVEKMASHGVPTHYEIYDRQTKAVVGKVKTRTGARRSVDRRDNEYGAYRYNHRPVYGDEK